MSAHPRFTYDDYLKSVGGVSGMSEAQFNEAFGISSESVVLPLHITPKKQAVKKSSTTEEATKPKKRKPLTPKQKEEKNKTRNVKRREERRKNPNFKVRADLSQMTPEEVKAHRSKLQRERMAKKRANGWVEPPRTPEQIEQRKAYQKKYYARMKDNPDYKAKRSASNRKYDAKRMQRLERVLPQ